MFDKRVVYVYLVIWFCDTNCQNSFFLAKNNYNYVCVTNSSCALSWIDESATYSLRQVSHFIPTSRENIFDCIITEDPITKTYYTNNGYWSLKRNNEIILDQRWEEMTEIITNYVDGYNQQLLYVKILSNLKNEYEIPLSIRTEREAHIFLCDGDYPPWSNCYWFMLQAFSGKGSAIRKCAKGDIPRLDKLSPKNCSTPLKRVNHSRQFPSYLSNKYWSHFKLERKNNFFSFRHTLDNTEETILELTDTDHHVIDVTHMIIHSKMVDALWKIHKLEYIYTDQETHEINLGPPITPENDVVCISMFVSMCNHCQIKLTLFGKMGKIFEKIYVMERPGWSEIKFIVENLPYQEIQLAVSTIGAARERFWAIDNVRRCQKNEFRMIKLNYKATCQLMCNENNIIGDKNFVNAVDTGLFLNNNLQKQNCPENTIGEFCVPCTWIYNNCERTRICSKSQTTEIKCFCSAGYQSDSCDEACRYGYYGHGCQKPCGSKCNGKTCHMTDGTCYSCIENYRGPKCDTPPLATFTKPPKITSISYMEAVIDVTDYEAQNESHNDQPYIYAIMYMKIDDTQQNWKYVDSSYEFNNNKVVKIDHLEIDTQYAVRCIFTTYGNSKYITPQEIFTTKCQEISENNIHVEPFSTSVKIYLGEETTKWPCKYRITITPNARNSRSESNKKFFDNLTPFTEYTVTIHRNQRTYTKAFHTAEGVPQSVQNLRVSNESPSSVELQWQKPRMLHGRLKHYSIKYQHRSYVACEGLLANSSSNGSLTATKTSVTVTDLLPYSLYSFAVSAVNTKFESKPQKQYVTTLPLHEIQDDEIPRIIDIVPSNNSAIINISQINCTKMRGTLSLLVIPTCVNEWCHKHQTVNYQLPRKQLFLNGLIPFSDYKTNLKFCGNSRKCRDTEEKQFKTRPGVPNKVEELLVYSKSENTLSLRWKPPYPPTGILANYYVYYTYYTNNRLYVTVNVNNSICKLWSEFHCVKLSNLVSYQNYNVEIFAENEDPSGFGKIARTAAITQVEQSEAPYDLKLNWTVKNDLELQWKHPNQSNGEIQYFRIELITSNSKIIRKQLSVTEDTYSLNYYYKIDNKELHPTTQYQINIAACNKQIGKELIKKEISPPDIPSVLKTPEIYSSNDSITIKIQINRPRGFHNNYELIVLVPNQNPNTESHPKLENFDLRNFRTVSKCSITNFDQTLVLVIGEHNQPKNCDEISNPPLDADTSYNITMILINTFQNESRYSLYSYIYSTTGNSPMSGPSELNLLALLLLLLIIPIVAILFIKRHQLIALKNSLLEENNSSNEVLEIQEEPLPLSNFQSDKTHSVNQKKDTKIQPTNSSQKENKYSKSIKITEFEDYVKNSIKNGELERQHALFPRGQTKPWTYGVVKENKSKNRYNNLIAYDHSRVILEKVNGNPHSDYINANYIDGYKISKAYIATQGPKSSTLFDFWRMIWQENTQCIAMLANVYESGKKKVEKYWPAINETLKFGDISIRYVSHKVYADFEHRVFQISRKKQTRKVEQLHFSSWPDHGVPLYSQSLVSLLQKILKLPLSSKSPLVVHCSAGVGRTGTILLCDICLRMAAREGSIDVLRWLQKLREQRPNLVDNVEQYKLAHLVILECLFGKQTAIPCNDIDESVEKLLQSGEIKSQMEYLKKTRWQDDAMKTTLASDTKIATVSGKNRFQDIIPEFQGQIFISRDPPDDEASSYINAIAVDGFRCPGRFIVTQQPLPNTLGDFWRLIDEKDVSVIISLNRINLKDKTSCNFWPISSNFQMNPIDHITLRNANTLSLECYDLVTIHMNTDSGKDRKVVEIFSLKHWPPKASFPKSMQKFLTFWEDSDAASRKSDTVVVTCYDGVKASGVYVAMSFIIEKMKLEQSCDVCQAVRTIRHNRNQFVQEEEQFAFLYRAAVDYINGFQSYANFS